MKNPILRIGDWRVDPRSLQISRPGESSRLEPRAMSLLIFLAEQVGEVVSIDSLLEQVWSGVTVTPDSVYQAVTSLRRLLGDDAKQPKYIATVPRRGYRLVATVAPWDDPRAIEPESHALFGTPPLPIATSTPRSSSSYRRIGLLLAACAIVCLGLGGARWLVRSRNHTRMQATIVQAPSLSQSVGVLPFLDLTEGMKQGEFTDGMTEELIDKLSKVPGLRVPSPTSSFYFRDKQLPISDVAGKLGVAFVLDGSVRKSGARVRVAARFVRADTGFVVWSETYDRPWHYTVMLQDDIAGELAKAVEASFEKHTR